MFEKRETTRGFRVGEGHQAPNICFGSAKLVGLMARGRAAKQADIPPSRLELPWFLLVRTPE